MAAGLLAMFARSSRSLPDRDAIVARADRWRAHAMQLVDADRQAYAQVLDRREQRAQDPDGFRSAVAGANLPPLAVTVIGTGVAKLAYRVLDAGNPAVRGDLVTGIVLADAAVASAAELIASNTEFGGLPAEDLRHARARHRDCRAIVTEVTGGGT